VNRSAKFRPSALPAGIQETLSRGENSLGRQNPHGKPTESNRHGLGANIPVGGNRHGLIEYGTGRRSVFLGIAGGSLFPAPSPSPGRNPGGTHVEGVSFLAYEGEGLLLSGLQRRLSGKDRLPGYVVALYLPDGRTPASALGPVREVGVQLLLEIPGPEFGRREEIHPQRSTGRPFTASGTSRQHQPPTRTSSRYRYALTYRPGRGTGSRSNGKPLVLVEGDDFAAAYFSIWLGKKPIDEDLKNELSEGG